MKLVQVGDRVLFVTHASVLGQINKTQKMVIHAGKITGIDYQNRVLRVKWGRRPWQWRYEPMEEVFRTRKEATRHLKRRQAAYNQYVEEYNVQNP